MPQQAELRPFIYLYGRAEEALAFYKAALGGEYSVLQRNTANGDPRLDPTFVGKVSYAVLNAPGIALAISDGGGPKTIDPDAGNITLAVSIPDAEKAAAVFTALAEGGTPLVSFADAPWGGGKFGHVRDKFQTEWFVTS